MSAKWLFWTIKSIFRQVQSMLQLQTHRTPAPSFEGLQKKTANLKQFTRAGHSVDINAEKFRLQTVFFELRRQPS